MRTTKQLFDTTIVSIILLLTGACTANQPQTSDTERLIGEALQAVGSHDLPTAEQCAYSAAILSADSAEMADAMTMLSLVFMLENKKEKAEMVMTVLPEKQLVELVRLQQAANDQGRSHDRVVFGGFIALLMVAFGGAYWWNRRRKAAFERKVDELMLSLGSGECRVESERPRVGDGTSGMEFPTGLPDAHDTKAAANSSKATGRRDSGNLFTLHSSLNRSDIVRTKQGVDVLYAILHNENISQMGKREQKAVAETLHVVEPRLASIIDSVELTPKETFYCIMQYYGKTEQQKAQCFCCTEQALRSTKSRLGKKLDLTSLENYKDK